MANLQQVIIIFSTTLALSLGVFLRLQFHWMQNPFKIAPLEYSELSISWGTMMAYDKHQYVGYDYD